MSDKKLTGETSIEDLEELLKDLPRIVKELEEEHLKKEIVVEEPSSNSQIQKK
ncbi:hypothetical protein [Sporomusa sp.]|uniref:hypothetical protein n=1 Tax=Sporomusa sp. TaxID=2078658 RepID=UPI002BC19E0A|nr:hypothetical protein [Sporomusa sp.]HWR45313.1 hypothetical protein [Sporomusa sp.]